MRKLFIIGAGMGDPSLLTAKAITCIEECVTVIAPERIADSLKSIRMDIVVCSVAELSQAILDSPGSSVAVLVSGDAGFYSVSKLLREKLDGSFDIETLNGLNSLQYLTSRLGVSYDDAEIVSLHGREAPITGIVSYSAKTFFLTGGQVKAHDICGELQKAGLTDVEVTVAENLSSPDERLVCGTPAELATMEFCDLAVMLVQNPEARCPALPLFDRDFARGEVPMTKEEVRWTALSKLGVLPTHTVYDIGAGTGSVAIELARRARAGRVFAIEREADAAELIEVNRRRFGAYNVSTVIGSAMDVLDDLPFPDRVFIGGSGDEMLLILENLAGRGKFRVCITAIALGTLNSAINALESLNFSDVEVVCVNISRSKKVRDHHMMMAQNPIYIISGELK